MKPWSWPWGIIPLQEKEYKELTEKAEKLEAVKKQLVEFPCIHIQDYQRMIWKIKKILEAEE